MIQRADFVIGLGNLLEPIVISLRQSNGTIPATAIPGGTTATLRMRHRTSHVLVTHAMTVVDAALWKVRYDWVAGDTDKYGLYDAKVRLVYPGGQTKDFPNDRYFLIQVSES